MSKHKQMREYRVILAEHGVEIDAMRQTKHVVVHASYRGRPLPLTLSLSPSDRRHMLNFRAQLRREIAKIDADCP